MKLFCPTCGPNCPSRPYDIRSGYVLRRCTACGLVFMEELTEAVNADFYEDVAEQAGGDAIEYWSFPDKFDAYRPVFEGFFEERWDLLRSATPNIRRLLDVGCGYGLFLQYAARQGPTCVGLELDPTVATHAREAYGLDVRSIRVEDFYDDTPFDAIVMADVLEHLPDAKEVLTLCRQLLAPDGVLFIQVPNVLGFKLPWGHSWGLPHHIWQFSRSSLRQLLNAAGFQIASMQTGIMGVIGVYERGGPSWSDQINWSLARTLGIGNRLAVVAIPHRAEKP